MLHARLAVTRHAQFPRYVLSVYCCLVPFLRNIVSSNVIVGKLMSRVVKEPTFESYARLATSSVVSSSVTTDHSRVSSPTTLQTIIAPSTILPFCSRHLIFFRLVWMLGRWKDPPRCANITRLKFHFWKTLSTTRFWVCAHAHAFRAIVETLFHGKSACILRL